MAFSDKHGITELPTESPKERLALSYEIEDGEDEGTQRVTSAILLHVPHVEHHEHSHIVLTEAAVRDIHAWTGAFLAELPPTLEARVTSLKEELLACGAEVKKTVAAFGELVVNKIRSVL